MADQKQTISAKIEGINWEDFVSPEDLKNAQLELGQLRSRANQTDCKLETLVAENRELEQAKALLVSENRSLKIQLDQQINRSVQGQSPDTGHARAIESLSKELDSERGSVKSMEAQLQRCKKRIEELESCKLAPTQEPMSPSRSVQGSPITIPPPPVRPPQPPPVKNNPFGI